MRGFIKACIIGFGVTIIVVLFEKGLTSLGTMAVILVCLYVFEKLNTNQVTAQKLPAYRIKLAVCPKWDAILPIVPQEYVECPSSFFAKMMDDPELEIDKEQSLLNKKFHYTIFEDEASGMSQVWSHLDKSFVDDMDVFGDIISGNIDKIQEKYKVKKGILNNLDTFVIRPYEIGYACDLIPFYIYRCIDRTLSQIPLDSILHHLKKLHTAYGEDMRGILKFPDELQKAFDDRGVKYETWDTYRAEFEGKPLEPEFAKHVKEKSGFEISHDTMHNHVFSTEYYYIQINIKIFSCGCKIFEEAQ